LVTKLAAIEIFWLPLPMVTKTFQSPQGVHVICFWKALNDNFPKTYTCPHFWSPSNSGGVLIGDRKFQSPFDITHHQVATKNFQLPKRAWGGGGDISFQK
jgi:hypothetical protein